VFYFFANRLQGLLYQQIKPVMFVITYSFI